MQRIRARVPWSFFTQLLPFNAQLLNGNAMLVRACGAKPQDGSILQSKSYLLFGNGIATLLPQVDELAKDLNARRGFVMEFIQKRDKRNVMYWEAQCVQGDGLWASASHELRVSSNPPDEFAVSIIDQPGNPGQYIYLS